jgi:hypothetical protein
MAASCAAAGHGMDDDGMAVRVATADVPWVVVERSCLARHPQEPNADRIVVGPHLVAVVDGSTAKPWEPVGATGVEVAETVAKQLEATSAGETLDEVLERASNAVAALPGLASVAGPDRPCATFAAVHLASGLVWRVGDQSVMVDGGELWPPSRPEAAAAEERATVLLDALRAGASIETLRADDPGRAAILPRLRQLNQARNVDAPGGFGAVDGTAVPRRHRETWALPRGTQEVVLASDGYPEVSATLAEAEAKLAGRLASDPLMVEQPPATKGVAPGAASYDDRAYVRIRREGRG